MNATRLRKNLFETLNRAVQYNEVISVATKDGNAVLMNENDYRDLLATVEIMSNAPLYAAIREGMAEPLESSAPYDPNEVW